MNPAADAGTSDRPGSEFDCPRYYTFVLEALDRFGHEGLHLKRPWTLFPKRKPSLMAAVVRRMRERGLGEPRTVLEFGVYKGASIRTLAKLLPTARLFGFDTFTGFPEDGRSDWRRSDFATAAPAVPSHVELLVGAFDDTLPVFVERKDTAAPADLIHVDCDLYSSAASAFAHLGRRFIAPGTVIVFDELLNYDGLLENEFLALYEMLDRLGFGFEWFVTIGALFPLEALARGETPGGWAQLRALGCYQNTSIVVTSSPPAEDRLARFDRQGRDLARARPLRQPLVAGR